MNRIIKATAKKIVKSGLFTVTDLTATAIKFENVDGVKFFFDLLPGKPFGFFRAGYLEQWKELAPTFESEYNSLGWVERARFSPILKENTDNPDFIYRAAMQITLV